MNNGLIQWSPGVTLEMVERQAIFAAFEHFNKNKSATANALGITVRTLDNKFEKYKVDDASFKKQQDERLKHNSDWLARSRGQAPAPRPFTEKEKREKDAKTDDSAEAGLRAEPAVDAPAKPPVPLQERREVQAVLPPQAAASGGRGRR